MKMPTLKKTVVDPRAVDQIITGEETPAPTTRAKKGKTRLVSISLPDEILDKLNRESERYGISRSLLIRLLLAEDVKNLKSRSLKIG